MPSRRPPSVKKFKLLLLDANIVIEIWRLGIWEEFLARCDIHLSRIVAEEEAHFFVDARGERRSIDLTPSIKTGVVTVFDLTPSQLSAFRALFDPVYLEKLDDGEAESLAHLWGLSEEGRICSADAIVYRILGNARRGEQGISLEEVLAQTGLGRKLTYQFTKAFRERWTRAGFNEGLGGLGTR